MATIIPFQPSIQAPFQFQATLDGELYTVICRWNLYRQGFYINVYDLSNNLIVSVAQVGSPPDYDINLVGGYFVTSSLVFRQSSNSFEISP